MGARSTAHPVTTGTPARRQQVAVTVLLAAAAGIALFLLSPLAPHRTTAVTAETSGTSGVIQVVVSDRQGRRTAPLDEAASMPADLVRPEPGSRLPVLTYRSGRVVYDDGSLLPTLWGAAALLGVVGLAVGARGLRRKRP